MVTTNTAILAAGLASVVAAKSAARAQGAAGSSQPGGSVVAEDDHLSIRIPRPRDGRDGVDGVNGKDGRDGRDGKDGEAGRPGKDGAPGRDGKDGARGPMPDHEWDGTSLRFQRPDGGWGQSVELRGKDGERGPRGPGGASAGATAAAPDLDATFTYGGDGSVQRIDYEDGSHKTMTYAGGLLVQVDHVAAGVTRRSAFAYGPDGQLLSVVKTQL